MRNSAVLSRSKFLNDESMLSECDRPESGILFPSFID